MKRIDWRPLGQAGDGDWLGFRGVQIVARITKLTGYGYQWYVNDETGIVHTAGDAMDICTRQAKEAE